MDELVICFYCKKIMHPEFMVDHIKTCKIKILSRNKNIIRDIDDLIAHIRERYADS